MFNHILVPVDGSDNALAALDKAVELSGIVGARLSLITVYRHFSLLEASFSMVRHEDPGPMDDAMRAYAKEIAEHAKAHAVQAGATDPHAFVKNGPVARSIVAFARQHDVDLIMMGGRGVGSTESYLLGSVSHKVTGTSHCPVMVI